MHGSASCSVLQQECVGADIVEADVQRLAQPLNFVLGQGLGLQKPVLFHVNGPRRDFPPRPGHRQVSL